MNRGRGRNAGGYRTPTRGRSYRPRGAPVHHHGHFGADGSTADVPLGSNDDLPKVKRQTAWQKSAGGNLRQYECKPTLDYLYEPDQPSPGIDNLCSHTGKLSLGQNLPQAVDRPSQQPDCLPASDSAFGKELCSSSAPPGLTDRHGTEGRTYRGQNSEKGKQLDLSPPMVNTAYQSEGSSILAKSHSKDMATPDQGPGYGNAFLENEDGHGSLEHSESSSAVAPFDICPATSGSHIVLKASLFSKNRERRNENKRSMEGLNGSTLRAGMVLLKSYFSCSDQVKIVKKCRDLGLGSGGFYQPGYRDGAKLQLKMMCLGKNWDPEKGEYLSERPIDGTKPPGIPTEFYQLVEDAIEDSHKLIKKEGKGRNAEDILPWMTPDICIVNFYARSGRLGLHQDKDESSDSLRKRLPVVSFSFGDTAEFLYGDERDTEKADKVLLESGDVLIFGGQSRHVFHGVSAIHANTAPKALLEETQLRPGRLNLTFREY
ncbi:uncharacterized protein LOC131163625 [Malania oleifera]|uniref:uncharacterized protein LOC131163625 n=1 Tax=Malania oleifera TaxID=397392 RepID=UPI0025AE992B|nr:uncharacterized protein LOC131163625 [Malania oleifera]XP_057976228.1 uncharacterized protein LOC131163625 [Malania oleifera]